MDNIISLNWVETNGGPIVVLPNNLLNQWKGQENNNGISDYSRACAVSDYILQISIGTGFGLVLGGDPCPTTVFTSPMSGHLVIARWVWAESDESAQKFLISTDFSMFNGYVIEFENDSSEISFIDSAYSDLQRFECLLNHNLVSGHYLIETFDFRPDPKTWFVIHIFKQS